jgi:DNA-binding GntR family transcriptional regulator
MTLQLEPGQIIREVDLIKLLEISRTPLREALIKLSSMYLIDIIPQSKTRVSLINPNIIEEGIFLRLQVESAIVEKVCELINDNDIMQIEEVISLQNRLLENNMLNELLIKDNAFHQMLYTICGAERTYHAVATVCGQYDIIRTLSLYNYTSKRAIQDHAKLFEAIKKRDKKLARDIITEHIARHSKEYLLIEKKFPQYFIK